MWGRAIQPVKVTARQLSEALVGLGYVREDTPQATVFRHGPQDAVILLPLMEPDETVSQAHLIAARSNATGRGVATPEQFQAQLAAARRAPVAARRRARVPKPDAKTPPANLDRSA